MPEMSAEEIRSELAAIRTEISRAIVTGPTTFAKDHSKWSAHGDWSSGKGLEGRINLSSDLSQVGTPPTAQLEKLMSDASSERFLQVARSLREMLGEK